MKRLRFADLWRWDGTVDRGPYALVGLLGFALKHNLDRLIASAVFNRRWELFNYFIPPDKAVRPDALPANDQAFLLTMVVLSLPFVWVGLSMTLRRLRSIGLPSWLVGVFFFPFVNLAFFLLLAVLPARTSEIPPPTPRHATWLGRLIPDHPMGSAAMALLLTTLLGVAATCFSVSGLLKYGWGLFVGLPFGMGFMAALLHGYHHPKSFRSSVGVAMLTMVVLGGALMALAIEGVMCIVMAAPLGIVLAALGGWVAYLVRCGPADQQRISMLLLGVVAGVPGLMGAEYLVSPAAPLFAVRTAIEVNAPPATVWEHVVSFSELPEPTEWLFRLGIAYPTRAVIEGAGVGAQRHCVFSTGEFVEPIEVWQPPTHLKFSVTKNPPAMKEWTPYRHLNPPHLENFLVSEGGQFLLEPLPGGRTRLEGTTWYRHNMWPAAYWRRWSDFIIHRIHLRVLKHIDRISLAAD